MRRSGSPSALPFALLLAACAASGNVPSTLPAELAEAPPAAEARLWLTGDRVVAATVPIEPELLPMPVRTTLTAVAPDGERRFTGIEHGPRGRGYRIEVHYSEPEHDRSVLIAEDGAVLERAHTIAVPDVSEAVLARALRTGPRVLTAWIVSGPEREEYWELVVLARDGQTVVLRLALDGGELARRRRGHARIDG